MKQDLTFIAVVLDRSGSMQSVSEDTIGGFNGFLEEQQACPGEALFTLVQFAEHACVPAPIPISDMRPLNEDTYRATGNSTALYDAIGATIDSVGARLHCLSEKDRPGKVLIMIQTDGHENSSTHYTRAQVAKMIKHQREKYTWDFVFIGASEQAVADAIEMGVAANFTNQYAPTPEGTSEMLRSMSAGTANYRTSGKILTNFFVKP